MIVQHLDRGDGRSYCASGGYLDAPRLRRCMDCDRDGEGEWTRASVRSMHRETQAPRCAARGTFDRIADMPSRPCFECRRLKEAPERRAEVERAREEARQRELARKRWPEDFGRIPVEAKRRG